MPLLCVLMSAWYCRLVTTDSGRMIGVGWSLLLPIERQPRGRGTATVRVFS